MEIFTRMSATCETLEIQNASPSREIYMSQIQRGSEARHFDLLWVSRALRNEKALFALLVTGLLAGTLIFLGAALADPKSTSNSFLVAGLFVFLALLVFPVGGSIAGLLLMDQARGREPRALRYALFDGITAALRIFSVSLIGIVLVAVFYFFLGLLLFLCKAPVAGPVLYAVIFPILVVLAGLLFFSLLVALSMAGPAIWSGATIGEALNMLWQVATNRVMELLISLFFLTRIIALALFILGSILLVGCLTVKGASTAILSDSIPDLFGPGMNPGHYLDNEYAMAAIFGAMIGLVLILSALIAMAMMGLNLIYLRVTEDAPSPHTGERTQPLAHQDPWLKQEPPAQAATLKSPPWQRQEPTVSSGAGGTSPKEAVSVTLPNILASIAATATPPASPGIVPPAAPEVLLAGTTPSAAAESLPVCPHCKAIARPGDHFCGECGGKFGN
jgi:hypothetical protein